MLASGRSGGGGQVVSVLAFYSDDPSSNPCCENAINGFTSHENRTCKPSIRRDRRIAALSERASKGCIDRLPSLKAFYFT